ncbi:MAG: bis(5'-nucleosyl)-tetraphosphatase (symmetrical) YqeK [Lachnospiraceae bacterium]|nr:bis(5'-nucleosyl)-tetraphosphatase (symmetrical) YqeK [Lachnospiraceae bacterium]
MLFDGATDEEVLPFIDEKELLYIRKFHLYEKKVEYDTKAFLQKLKEDLKPSRFTHTIGVADTAASLAMKYGYDMNRAYVSGLLHDCAKYMTNEQLMTYCKNNGLAITEGEIKAPHLLHAKAGEHMAKVKYGVKDEEILHAISVHTTGCPNMSLLDKILFVADYIEPNRDKAHRLQEIRELAFWNLDFAILLILEDTISYIEGKNQYLDQGTIDTFDYYLKEKNS